MKANASDLANTNSNLITINNILSGAKKLNAFSQKPADMLGNNNLFTINHISTPTNETDNYAPPVNWTSTGRWFNVLTFGTDNRCTQIACYGYLGHGNDNKVWIRTQHDASVSAWKEL